MSDEPRSISHWGMFPSRQLVILMPSNWTPSAEDLRPGQIIRMNGLPHQCLSMVTDSRGMTSSSPDHS